MLVDKMPIGQMTEEEMPVDKMPVDKLTRCHQYNQKVQKNAKSKIQNHLF
jgi:hypothetical protein